MCAYLNHGRPLPYGSMAIPTIHVLHVPVEGLRWIRGNKTGMSSCETSLTRRINPLIEISPVIVSKLHPHQQYEMFMIPLRIGWLQFEKTIAGWVCDSGSRLPACFWLESQEVDCFFAHTEGLDRYHRDDPVFCGRRRGRRSTKQHTPVSRLAENVRYPS